VGRKILPRLAMIGFIFQQRQGEDKDKKDQTLFPYTPEQKQ